MPRPERFICPCTGGWVGPHSSSGWALKICPPPGFGPRTVQPVAIPTDLSRPLLCLLLPQNPLPKVSSSLITEKNTVDHNLECLLYMLQICLQHVSAEMGHGHVIYNTKKYLEKLLHCTS